MRGRNSTTMIPEIRKMFDVNSYQAKRLLVTETARMQTEVQKEMYTANDVDEYIFMAEPSACKICSALDGKTFQVSDMTPGKNASPMHPHCHCATAPDASKEREELERLLEEVEKERDNADDLKEKIDKLDMATATKDDIINIGRQLEEKHHISEHLGDKEKLKEIFSNYRDIGGVVPRETWSKGTARVVKAQLEEAFSYYPKEWAEIPRNNGRQLYIRKAERGYFSQHGAVKPPGNIYDTKMSGYRDKYLTIVTNGKRKTTPYHEIGHMVQWNNPNIVRIEKEWIEARTADENYVRLKDLFPLSNYGSNEVVKKDNFVSPYIGKYYDDSTEVLPMGLQGIFEPNEAFRHSFDKKTWKDTYKTITDDEEFLHLTIGLFVKG